jgi:hypothetical protein
VLGLICCLLLSGFNVENPKSFVPIDAIVYKSNNDRYYFSYLGHFYEVLEVEHHAFCHCYDEKKLNEPLVINIYNKFF